MSVVFGKSLTRLLFVQKLSNLAFRKHTTGHTGTHLSSRSRVEMHPHTKLWMDEYGGGQSHVFRFSLMKSDDSILNPST